MTDEQRERIRIVQEDLVFLRDEWDHEVTEASLRRTSPVLRRLLVDGHLGHAWRDIGFDKQPAIHAPNLAKILEGIPPEIVAYAQAGGARYKDLKMGSILELKIALNKSQASELNRRMAEPGIHQFTLAEFQKAVSIVIEGTSISRAEIVKYISNKIGGAHLDPKRNPSDSLEKKFILLDSCRKTISVAEASAVFFELLSIGQSIVKSQDTANFLYASGGGPYIPLQPSIMD